MTEHSGGIHWELRQARKEIIAAQQAGDDAAETLGWMHLADALVNAASSGSAKELVPMLKSLRVARAESQAAHQDRRSDAIVSEHNQAMLIDQAEIVQAEQGQQAARLGLAEASILALLLSLAMSKADRQALTERDKEHTERISALERRVAVLEDARAE